MTANLNLFEVDRAPLVSQVGSGYISYFNYGVLRYALGSVKTVQDAFMTATFTLLTSATANFQASDVGKTVIVAGAGASGGNLVTTIAAFGSVFDVTLTDAAGTTVLNAQASWGTPVGSSGAGILRYWYGTPAINGVLVYGRPYAGVLRRMLTGNTNFEVIATRLPDDVSNVYDTLKVPDFAVLYIKYGVLYLMFSKEGEQQDMARAQYAKARYDRGIQLFRKVMGVETKDEVRGKK